MQGNFDGYDTIPDLMSTVLTLCSESEFVQKHLNILLFNCIPCLMFIFKFATEIILNVV